MTNSKKMTKKINYHQRDVEDQKGRKTHRLREIEDVECTKLLRDYFNGSTKDDDYSGCCNTQEDTTV